MLRGVRVKVLESRGQRTLSEYMLAGDRAVLTSGKPIPTLSISAADAALAPGLVARVYTPDDGKWFLRALLVTFKSGSRMLAERF